MAAPPQPGPSAGADTDADTGPGTGSETGDGAADGTDADDAPAGAGRPCPACGAGMTRRHCEYVCPRHGVVYDCSDTFW